MAHCSPDELREKFAKTGYEQFAEELIAKSRPALALVREPSDDDDIAIGASKLGGCPDLPPGFEWPHYKGRPLAFLGQFSLAEAPSSNSKDGEPSLPSNGLLSVFYDIAEQPWGFDPEDRGAAQVFYWREPPDLVRVKPPSGAFAKEEEYDKPFNPCSLTYEPVTTYPTLGEERFSEEEIDEIMLRYGEVVEAGQGGDESPRHQLFGHPLIIQNPMEEECQLASNGISMGQGEPGGKDRQRTEELQGGVKDWVLLLQVDSDDTGGWMWGDVGMLFFWIRRQDLDTCDFSKVWCILQCG